MKVLAVVVVVGFAVLLAASVAVLCLLAAWDGIDE